VGHGLRGKAHAGTIDGGVAEQVAVMMQALATSSRVLILARLRESPHAVGELAAAVGMELSAVSHQLRLLRQLGLVVGERQGRQIVYALYDSHVADLLDDAAYHLEHLRLRHRERGRARFVTPSSERSQRHGHVHEHTGRLIADGNHARIDGFVSLGVVASALVVALGAQIGDPLIGLAITLVILKITWDSWRTVSTTEPGELVELHEH
jgi:ArsR family transcriptional regulator, nickel/cobalt-responsive transcriptional repressor